MPQKSKEWLQVYTDIEAQDQMQSRLIDLLDDSIHSSQKDLIAKRADSLVKLVSDMDLESALRLNYRFKNKRDPLNELVTLELSDSLATKLRRITARKAETGDRFTSPSHRGTASTVTTPTAIVPLPQNPIPPKIASKPSTTSPVTKTPDPQKTKTQRKEPKIIYPDPDPYDPFAWITKGLSTQEVIARTAVQMGVATGVGIFVLAEWMLTDALQIAANFILHRLGSTVPKMVGNAGEKTAYFILKELMPANMGYIVDLNAIATDFPVFDFFTPSEGFISVKTYGVLSKTKDVTAYAKSKIKSDFKKLFETNYIDKAIDKILSSGQTLPVPRDRAALEEYMVKNFKFCVPQDQVPGAISAFSEYIDENRNDFPELNGLDPKTDPTKYTIKVKEIAGSHVMGFPVSTSTLRDLYEIATRLGDIKQVLKSKNRNDLDWYRP